MRGEIGSSLMKTRIIQTKIQYEKYMVSGRNDLMRKIVEHMEENGNKWKKQVNKFREEIGIRGHIGGYKNWKVRVVFRYIG